MLQTLEKELDMGSTLVQWGFSPFCTSMSWAVSPMGSTLRTRWKAAFPCLHVLGHLRHLNVGVELFNLVHDSVLVVIFEVKP